MMPSVGGFVSCGQSLSTSSDGVNYRISVPLNKRCGRCSGPFTSSCSSLLSSNAILSLTKGYDSPVRIASFKTADPDKINKSHGTDYFFLDLSLRSIITSPGQISSLIICNHLPCLCTQSYYGATLIALNLLKFYSIQKTTVPSNVNNITRVMRL